MNKILQHPLAIWISRVTLGFIFVVASIDKIAIPAVFAANIQAYQILPGILVNISAIILPWFELVCGLYLLAGYKLRASSVIITSMLLVFIGAILIAMMRGLTIDCGCFSAANATPVGWPKVIEDVGMLLLSLHILLFSETDPAATGRQEKQAA